MPFKSESQRKLCYLLKNKGQAGSWDCSEWSKETPKGKKLPEHVSEKKSADLEMAKKLARCWAGYKPVSGKEPYSEDSCKPISKKKDTKKEKKAALHSLFAKMSEVVASPGRGSGDEEATAINPEPYEGMQKAEPVKKVPGKMSFNKKPNKPVSPMGAARNAAAKASIKAFGFDPRGGAVKSAEGPAVPPAKPFNLTGGMIRAGASGLTNSIGDTFRAGFLGDQNAMSSLQRGAALPNLQQTAGNVSNFIDRTRDTFNQASKNFKPNYVAIAAHPIAASNAYQLYANRGSILNATPFPAMYNTARTASQAAKPFVMDAAGNWAAQNEARRISSGYGLQAAQFLQNNPWAKWALGGLGALGLYGIGNSLFGGGGAGARAGSRLQDSFHEGLASPDREQLRKVRAVYQ